MALVFLAEERGSRRRMAVKVLDPAISSHLIRARFLKEVELTSLVTHPQAVPIIESGEVDGLYYYVMPYLGESLRQRLDRAGRPSPSEALNIIRDVAEVLAYAHARDIVHRDIKPANILLQDGRAVVADFGIAKAICASCGPGMTMPGLSLGSPGYMSPEQAFGSADVDARTDLFSLGCVLYEMLVGGLPIPRPGRPRAERRRLGSIPEEHRRRIDELPRGMEELLASMLAWDPEDRPASAVEVTGPLQSLHRALQPQGQSGLRKAMAWLAQRGRES
jgi:serine/threonine-protein kinase